MREGTQTDRQTDRQTDIDRYMFIAMGKRQTTIIVALQLVYNYPAKDALIASTLRVVVQSCLIR